MILWNDKDGGEESRVWCWGIELKRWFSVLLLRFDEGSREAFHSHAFNSLSWVLRGGLRETQIVGAPRSRQSYTRQIQHAPSLIPVLTQRSTFHMVEGLARATWVLTFRGPWADNWREFIPQGARHIRLTHGRKELP